MSRAPAAAWILAMFVTACAAPDARPPEAGVDPAERAAARDAAALALDRFRVRGGLGVWNDERSMTARIDWRQQGDALDIRLAAPLGFGDARLVRTGDGQATLTRGDAAPVTGRVADEVLQRGLGLAVPVPVDQLASWLRGLPGDGRDVRRDPRGRLASLRWQDAGGTTWRARVLKWTSLDGLELPALVTAQGAGERLRLVLRDWSAGGDPESVPVAPELPARRAIPGR